MSVAASTRQATSRHWLARWPSSRSICRSRCSSARQARAELLPVDGNVLQPGQDVGGDVAADMMARLALQERWLLLFADFAQLARAAGMEDAARGRVDRAGNLALQADSVARLAVNR